MLQSDTVIEIGRIMIVIVLFLIKASVLLVKMLCMCKALNTTCINRAHPFYAHLIHHHTIHSKTQKVYYDTHNTVISQTAFNISVCEPV